MNNWDQFFISLAHKFATKSKDPSTKCGCALVGKAHNVLALGYNGLPRGCNDNVAERLKRPIKYEWFEHAERNAIYNAARHGVALDGATAYITSPPCSNCARGLIQAGILRVVIPENHDLIDREDWKQNFELSKVMLAEAGVKYAESTQQSED